MSPAIQGQRASHHVPLHPVVVSAAWSPRPLRLEDAIAVALICTGLVFGFGL